MIWEALAQLQQWQRENLPAADSPVSAEIMVWLLKTRSAPRPLKDLYLSSQASEPTVRKILRAFVDAGLIELEIDEDDHRNRFPRLTPRFDSVVSDYQQALARLAALVRSES